MKDRKNLWSLLIYLAIALIVFTICTTAWGLFEQTDPLQILKILADCYKEEGQEEKKIATWERIVRIDHEETDITKALAEKYEADGDREKAISYYKKAILR